MRGSKTIYLVDDDAAVRHALGIFLESAGYRVRGFASATEFLEADDGIGDGVLLLDQRMPGISGMELQARLRMLGLYLPVIFITGHGDIQMSVTAMKAGAVDFLEKPFDNMELLKSVKEAFRYGASKRREWRLQSDLERRCANLTSRELEVMKYIVDGKSSREIAEQLGVSNRTIEVHRARVMAKMAADSLPDLVRKVQLCGLNHSSE